MPSQTEIPSDHHELVSALTTLYTVMDNLVLFDSEWEEIYFSPHPDHLLKTEYLLDAGFSQEAIDALQQMPYISSGIEILPSTETLNWINKNPTVDSYLTNREMILDNRDILMSSSAIKLSYVGTNGYALIYDASTKLVHQWDPMDHGWPKDHRQVPGKPAWEVYGPIISSFQRLENLLSEQGYLTFFGPEGVEDDPEESPSDAESLPKGRVESLRKLHESEKKLWKLRDVYLECGWDVEAEGPVQPTFRRDEFIARREDYF